MTVGPIELTGSDSPPRLAVELQFCGCGDANYIGRRDDDFRDEERVGFAACVGGAASPVRVAAVATGSRFPFGVGVKIGVGVEVARVAGQFDAGVAGERDEADAVVEFDRCGPRSGCRVRVDLVHGREDGERQVPFGGEDGEVVDVLDGHFGAADPHDRTLRWGIGSFAGER